MKRVKMELIVDLPDDYSEEHIDIPLAAMLRMAGADLVGSKKYEEMTPTWKEY